MKNIIKVISARNLRYRWMALMGLNKEEMEYYCSGPLDWVTEKKNYNRIIKIQRNDDEDCMLV